MFLTTYQASYTHVYRAAFLLFSLACEKNGWLRIESATLDNDIEEKWSLTAQEVRRIANLLSISDEDFRKKWHEETKKLHPYYQPFAADLFLYLSPIVRLSDLSETYLIPSPGHFIRGLRKKIFSDILSKEPNLGTDLGLAVQSYFCRALRAIFGDAFQDFGIQRGADCALDLGDIYIGIEIKIAIGESKASTMAPSALPKVWGRLYFALKQVQHRLALVENKKLLVAMLLVADHIVGEALAFIHFGFCSGLFKSMGLSAVEILSWNELERKLAKTSIEAFKRALLEKWKNEDGHYKGSIGGCEMEMIHAETLAHSYEYLDNAKKLFWAKIA